MKVNKNLSIRLFAKIVKKIIVTLLLENTNFTQTLLKQSTVNNGQLLLFIFYFFSFLISHNSQFEHFNKIK